MSLPKDLRDQLLTGYLDDALSADERARVDQLLQSDEDFASELAQLRHLRDSLKSLAQEDSRIKLHPGFADRVLGSAVAQAHAEGLDDDHPLIRLAEQPSSVRRQVRTFDWRLALGLVGLAASVAIAVFVLQRDSESGLSDPIAQSQQPPTADVAQDSDPQDGNTLDADGGDSAPRVESIASADRTDDSVSQDEDEVEAEMHRVEPAPVVESIAQSRESTQGGKPPGQTVEKAALVPIMVYSVRLTASGNQSDAIREALRRAGIDAAGEKKVTDQLANFVRREAAGDQEPSDVSVLYIQAPLKRLREFHDNLAADLEGIDSVEASSLEAPVPNLGGSLGPDQMGQVLVLVR